MAVRREINDIQRVQLPKGSEGEQGGRASFGGIGAALDGLAPEERLRN